MTAFVLERTGKRYADCRCHKLPDGLALTPGLFVEDLWMLGEGCKGRAQGGPGYVCERLRNVREYYRPWDRKMVKK